MTENLHTKLVAVLTAAGIQPALSEGETAVYPYVTFELPCEYRYAKDGPYKIVGNLTIRAVADDADEAEGLRDRIQSAIATGFSGLTPVPPDDEAEEGEIDGADDAVEEPEPAADSSVDDEEPEEHADEEVDPYIYTARLTDMREDCMDGIWVIEQDYILNQSE